MRTTRSNNFSPWMTCVPPGRLRRGDDGFHVGDINAVAVNLVAIHIDQQTRLASSRTTVKSVNPGTFPACSDLDCLS